MGEVCRLKGVLSTLGLNGLGEKFSGLASGITREGDVYTSLVSMTFN